MKYFDGHVRQGFLSILISRTMLFIVSGLLGVFVPLFIYQLFDNSVEVAVLFYGAVSLAFVLFLAFGVRFVDKIGFRRSLQVSAFIGAAYYLLFYFADKGAIEPTVFVVTAIIMLTLFRTAYWVPFHTEFTLLSDAKNRGRQVSVFRAMSLFMGIFLPFISAYLIDNIGFDFVFMIAVFLFLASSIPYRFMPVIPETYSWGYIQTWREFVHHGNTKVAISFFAQGAESTIALFLWPIFLYELFDGNLLDVGLVTTFIIAASVVLQLIVGCIMDMRSKKDDLLKWGGFFYAIGWVLKIFVLTTFHVFVAGVYHSVTQIFAFTSRGAISYDLLGDQNDYVDEFSVLREMYVNTGRFVAALLVVVFAATVDIKWLFIIGAVASLVFHFLTDRDLDLRTCKKNYKKKSTKSKKKK